MISELEAGHTYVAPGDEPKVERVAGGFLGCELAADPSGRYRIARIFPGENWDDAWRWPLSEPGVNVKEGEFLLAIDGVDLTTADNPYRLLEGKANRPVALLVNGKPVAEGARSVTVRTVESEQDLRYLDWVRSRMALVDRLSGGKVGYIHLPNTALEGNRMLQKLFYSQVAKPALIVDDRYNGGGFIPDRMIEMLSRNTLAFWARRDVDAMRTPSFAHDGPKAMLMNGYSSSGGDALPWFFRKQGLGPLVGTRTWGGLIGLSGNPGLVDGGSVDVPTFRIYDARGEVGRRERGRRARRGGLRRGRAAARRRRPEPREGCRDSPRGPREEARRPAEVACSSAHRSAESTPSGPPGRGETPRPGGFVSGIAPQR